MEGKMGNTVLVLGRVAILLYAVSSIAASNIYVTLEDGRTVVLYPDKTWDYAGERGGKKKLELNLQKLRGKGMAKKGDLMESLEFAKNEACRRMAGSLRKYIPAEETSDEALLRCITTEAEAAEFSKNFSEDGTVRVEIELDYNNIQNIKTCLGYE
ncbi:MAG: DUF3157 family protein [Chitinivibrionales bacterium]|nr:DUF3157 family protein [Chitinivibrionales bacterium]